MPDDIRQAARSAAAAAITRSPATTATDSAAFSADAATTARSATAATAARSAAAARSAIAATAAAFDVEKLENGLKPVELRSSRIWAEEPPTEVDQYWSNLRSHLFAYPAFSFWIRWYEAMRDGIPQNWDMLKEIALIDPQIWDAEDGPERVAELIAAIEARYVLKPEITEENRAQARRLAAKPDLLGTINEGLAQQIEDWISALLRKLGANELPDELKPLESMPAILRGMAAGAGLDDQNDRIEKLQTRIAQLEAQVVTLNAALTEAKANPKNTIFSDSLRKKAGESLGDWKMWGALAGGAWFIFGETTGLTSVQQIITLIKR